MRNKKIKKGTVTRARGKWLIFIAAGVVILSGAASVETSHGIASPATVYCEELGYDYSVKKTPEGEYGICHLPDGSAVEEWEFLGGKTGEEYSYCRQKGYEMKTVKSTSEIRCPYAMECAVCVLADGTEVEVMELMERESKEPTITPEKKNYLFYLIGLLAIIIIIVIAAFAIYKKRRCGGDDVHYRDEMR